MVITEETNNWMIRQSIFTTNLKINMGTEFYFFFAMFCCGTLKVNILGQNFVTFTPG